jgi:hypothetical protein
MSREIKYIGMDVHQEAIVIALKRGLIRVNPEPYTRSPAS